MTAAVEAAASVDDVPAGRRWLSIRVLIGAVVLVLIGSSIGWYQFVHTYSPLSDDPVIVGPATNTLRPITDGVDSTRYVLVGPSGTSGTADYTLTNTGRFSVRVLGLDRSHGTFAVTDVAWSPASGQRVGRLRDARNFPITLAPHTSVILQVNLVQPKCDRDNPNERIDAIPLRWSALDAHHVFYFDLATDQHNIPIIVCPSKAALAHIDNR